MGQNRQFSPTLCLCSSAVSPLCFCSRLNLAVTVRETWMMGHRAWSVGERDDPGDIIPVQVGFIKLSAACVSVYVCVW